MGGQDNKPKNPNAFPSTASHHTDTFHDEGMALRDYFAAKAMQGILSAKLVNGGKDFVIGTTGKSNQDVVGASYAIADSMLKERSK